MSALGDPGSMYLDKYFDFVLRKCRTGVHVRTCMKKFHREKLLCFKRTSHSKATRKKL